jgi:hypothetical protein
MTDSVRKIGFARVEFDASSKNLEETDDLLVVKNVVLSRQGIFPYGSKKAFKPGDELEAGAFTLDGAWLVAYDHYYGPFSPFLTNRDDIRGRTKNPKFDKDKAAIIGDLEFFKTLSTKTFIGDIKSGALKDVSVAFISDDLARPGKFGDESYDYVQTKFMFGHVAVALAEGRCPAPFCGIALDSVLSNLIVNNVDSANYVEVPLCESASGAFPPRVITLSEKEGILAVVGKSDPAADAEVLRYLFSKAKGWTLEKAQAWTKGHKDAVAGELTEKELRAKIVELEKQRQTLIEKLYPSPPRLPEAEQRVLQLELTLIDGQVHALTEVLAEKLAGVEGSAGDSADKGKPVGAEPPAPGAKVTPCDCPLKVAREEVERARRLLGSR